MRRPSKIRSAFKRMMARKKPPTGEAAECVVCLDAPTGVKLPCGHPVLCACSQRVDVQPVCRVDRGAAGYGVKVCDRRQSQS